MTKRQRSTAFFVVGGLLVALGLAFFLSPLASSSPDGLERVARDQGFAETARDHASGDSPLADYGVRGVDDEGMSTALSGVVGVVVTFGVGLVLFGVLRRVRPSPPPEPAGGPPAS